MSPRVAPFFSNSPISTRLANLDLSVCSPTSGAHFEASFSVKYFTLKDASKWAPEVGEQTLRSRLANLVDIGLLEKNGATRGLIYVFVDGYGRMKRSLKPQSVKVPERRFTKTRSAASVSRS